MDMHQQGDGMDRVAEIGSLAAAARTTIYGLKLEEDALDITKPGAPLTPPDEERRRGLETLTVAARGALFNVTGAGTDAFDRIESELSASYLLGVEAAPRDRDRRSTHGSETR